MIEVVQCQLASDGTRAIVSVRSDKKSFTEQIEELGSAAARNEALRAASSAGIKGSPGISGAAQAIHPRNKEGKSLDDLRDSEGKPLDFSSPEMQPAYYQAAFEITAKV
jgi:hypothetical protein